MDIRKQQKDQLINIFSKYPNLINIWEEYASSKLYLDFSEVRKYLTEDLLICGLQNLLPYIKGQCSILGRLRVGMNINNQIVFNELLIYGDFDQSPKDVSLSQIISRLRNSIKECKHNLLIIDLRLLFLYKQTGHSNILLINKENQTIERFEPNVGFTSLSSNYQLNRYLSELVDAIGYIYLPPLSICPRPITGWQSLEGVQPKEKGEVAGYCHVWSIFYTYLRLAYPEIEASEIIEDFSIIEPKLLRMIIRTITSMLVDICK